MDRLPQRDLRQLVHIGIDNAGDPRIAAGGLRVVHQHNGLAVVRHLHHARQQAVRQHFTIGGAFQRLPLQAVPHAVTLRTELPGGAPE